jgi:hypothetical protein
VSRSVITVSILRIPSIVAIGSSTDPSWDATYVAIWSSIELNTAIVCACALTLKPLLSRAFPRMFTHGDRSRPRLAHHDPQQHPTTIGARRVRRMPNDMSLETVDEAMQKEMSTQTSSTQTDVSQRRSVQEDDPPPVPDKDRLPEATSQIINGSDGPLSPLPLSPQREHAIV